ncbi:hypothetical protein [Treponema endosymbiont of Eucomonympha sp.]|nr:hypothetical protein [Treponema endosymbiont of Eucomonympha sp.]
MRVGIRRGLRSRTECRALAETEHILIRKVLAQNPPFGKLPLADGVCV